VTGLEKSARATSRNRPGAVTYLKSAALTLLGENGESRLDDADLTELVKARGAFEGEGGYKLLRRLFEKLT
jgi:hypothetical protein